MVPRAAFLQPSAGSAAAPRASSSLQTKDTGFLGAALNPCGWKSGWKWPCRSVCTTGRADATHRAQGSPLPSCPQSQVTCTPHCPPQAFSLRPCGENGNQLLSLLWPCSPISHSCWPSQAWGSEGVMRGGGVTADSPECCHGRCPNVGSLACSGMVPDTTLPTLI